ncbi:MAG: hypothetical protein HY753_04425 [Nitrospirae bacterium]|nr:hypothetical protein [Nitrospirota bacterium]
MHKRPQGYWKNKNNRISAIRQLVCKLNKPVTKITQRDFYVNGISGLLPYYNYSPYRALQEAGYNIDEAQMATKPMGYWKIKENRVAAIKRLVQNLSKPFTEVTANDFTKYGISTVLNYNSRSPYLALKEAGYEVLPWLMHQAPQSYWNKKEHRIEAVRWLLQKLRKPVTHVTQNDFKKNNLTGLLDKYNNAIYPILYEAGYNILPWEMHKAPQNFWRIKENRIKATEWLIRKVKKPIQEITQKDFVAHGLTGLINYMKSYILLLKEAGYEIDPLQKAFKPKHWVNKKNRIDAVRSLVNGVGGIPTKLKSEDFKKHKMGTLFSYYYRGAVYNALKEAGYNIAPWEMKRVQKGYWDVKENRINAVQMLVKKLGKKPEEITRADFKNNNLSRLLEWYKPSKCGAYETGEIFTFGPGYLLKYKSPVDRALIEAKVLSPHKHI